VPDAAKTRHPYRTLRRQIPEDTATTTPASPAGCGHHTPSAEPAPEQQAASNVAPADHRSPQIAAETLGTKSLPISTGRAERAAVEVYA